MSYTNEGFELCEGVRILDDSDAIHTPREADAGVTRGDLLRRSAKAGVALGVGASALAVRSEVAFAGEQASTAPPYATSTLGDAKWDAQVRQMWKGKKLRIGYTPPAGEEFYTEIENAMWAQMREYNRRFGVRFEWTRFIPTGHSAVENQIAAIKAWVAKGFDALVVSTAADFASVQKVYTDAAKRGTNVYQVNMPHELYAEDEIKAVSTIGYNNAEQAGFIAGKYIISQLKGKGDLLLVWGAPLDWAKTRKNGLDRALKGSGVKVVGFQRGNYVRDEGQAAALNLLTAHPKANAIYAENEEMGLGAAQAVAQRGLKTWDGKNGILVIGANGNLSAFDQIKRGRLTATVNVNPALIGHYAIEQLVRREVLGYTVSKILDVPTKVIDKSNVDEAMAFWNTVWGTPAKLG